ncbi:MAG TPA: glutaredoxin family protein [Candidatus Limnocylindria bacterium]|nr:glutaredoxin family protein [Candidatus Limnocylindria bacterium]
MSLSSLIVTLNFYRRDGCELCDEARDALQVVLEDRVRRGDPIPRVREMNLSRQPELEAEYGARVPVLAVGNNELALATSARQIGTFLDRVLGRLA